MPAGPEEATKRWRSGRWRSGSLDRSLGDCRFEESIDFGMGHRGEGELLSEDRRTAAPDPSLALLPASVLVRSESLGSLDQTSGYRVRAKREGGLGQ